MAICGGAVVSSGVVPDIERSLNALSYTHRARRLRWKGTGVIFGACNDGTLFSGDHSAAIAFDGRIDNRNDLLAAVQLPNRGYGGDAQLALCAFERWGDDFCNHIIGDFACAVWDGSSRSILLASDPGALRPLFYWLGQDEILFASEQRGLWCESRVPKLLDEEEMAAWLARLPREPSRSFYKDVLRVPPGHLVVWKNGPHQLKRYWHPEGIPILHLKRDQDYADALRASFEEAVRCRIDRDALTGSHLSGGLDSSSVTALAARQLATSGHSLVAFTAVPQTPVVGSFPGRFVDEGPKAAALARMYSNVEHVLVPNITRPLMDNTLRREVAQDWPILEQVGMLWLDAIGEIASQRGIKTLLIGAMGNLTVSYDGLTLLPQLARKGHWMKFANTLWQMKSRSGRNWRSILGKASASLLPRPLHRALRKQAGRPEAVLSDYSLINPTLLKSTGLEEKAASLGESLENLVGGDGRALRLAALDRSDHRGHIAAATRRLFRVDSRDPTSDRRLIELCLSIPEEQYLYHGEPRSLLRRTMAGLLPDEILYETRRGKQAADWFNAIDPARGAFVEEVSRLETSPLAQKCLDMPRLRRLVEDWPSSDCNSPEFYMIYEFAIPLALSAGRFIRRIEGGNA